MKKIPQWGAAALAATTLYLSGPSAPADEIITERLVPPAPVSVTPDPAPVIQELQITTPVAEPRKLTPEEKVRQAEKDYQRDLRMAARDVYDE